PVQASVQVQVLRATGRFELLAPALQLLELPAQRLQLALDLGDLPEQVDVALVAGGLLFERGHAVGKARALGSRGHRGQRGAGCRDEGEAAEDRGRRHGHGRNASWFGFFLSCKDNRQLTGFPPAADVVSPGSAYLAV